jgi:hypothetical protein
MSVRRTSVAMKAFRSLVGLVEFGAIAIGCDGGPSGLSSAGQPTYLSDSFSPTRGVDASGAAAPEVWWRMRINGGAPIISTDGIEALTFADQEIRFSAGGTMGTSLLASTSKRSNPFGTVTTQTRQTGATQLLAATPATIIEQTYDQMQRVTLPGITDSSSETTFVLTDSPAQRIFADRTDLDQLPVGHAEEASFTSTQTFSTMADGRTVVEGTQSAMVHQRWTVVEQLPTMTVLDRDYRRVVHVELVIDTTDSMTGQTSSQTQESWYAAGIGAIRMVPPLDVGFPSAPIELVDTNLRQK